MPDVVAGDWAVWMPGAPWLLPALLVVAGLAAWLTVLLLVHPVRPRGLPGVLPVQGVVGAHAALLALFADEHLVSRLPAPRRFFEHLGPDRFRREFGRALKSRIDEHVDDVMNRRNERAWLSLSSYARNRIYAHAHRRLPYVIDDFVDHVQHELDDIVNPSLMVQRRLQSEPALVSALFLDAFGKDLRRWLPVAGVLGALAALPPALFAGRWALPLGFAVAALVASAVVLLALGWPRDAGGPWPFRVQGILYRRRQRFLSGLAQRVANDCLAWRALVGEFLHGAQASRSRQIMRREVSGILDAPVFKATLQLLLGPEGVYAVKSSAQEKAMELLSSTPVSAALQESCRLELLRTLEHAAQQAPLEPYAALWDQVLARAWKWLPPLLGAAGLGLGLLAARLAA